MTGNAVPRDWVVRARAHLGFTCRFLLALTVLAALPVDDAAANSIGFSTGQTSQYLLVGTGSRTHAYGVDVDNRRLAGGIAITDPNGDIELSNVQVLNPGFGIRTTQTGFPDVLNGVSNATYNGTPFSSSNGITLNQNFSALKSDLTQAKGWMDGLTSSTAGVSYQQFANDFLTNTIITLQAGLNVIDLGKAGSDFKLSNANLTITNAAGVGAGEAVAIFRVVNGKNFLADNAKIIADASVGDHSVMFYNGTADSQAFNMNNMYRYGGNTPIPHPQDIPGIIGVSFWALGNNAEININNAIGCTQLIADKINLNDVDFEQCAFEVNVIPLPPAAWGGLALMGGLGLIKLRRSFAADGD